MKNIINYKNQIIRACEFRKRSFLNPRFKNISFLPLLKTGHPVFHTHVEHLQNLTGYPIAGRCLHVINRLPKFLSSYNYVSELEGLFSLLHKDFTRSELFNIPEAIKRVDGLIKKGNLKKIIFQSQGAYNLNSKWFTNEINSISTYVLLPPPEFFQRQINPSKSKINILILGSSIYRKGLFLLKDIIPIVRKKNQDIFFTCISYNQIPFLNNIEGLEMKVIKQMSDEVKFNIFSKQDYLLNLAFGDTLGTYLDSCRYNIPVIGFPGQHGESYVPSNYDLFVKAPLLEHESNSWDLLLKIREFPEKLKLLNEDNFFNQHIVNIADKILSLDISSNYESYIKNLYKFSESNLQIDQWLSNLEKIYDNI